MKDITFERDETLKSENVDVLIIGGGIAGLLAAKTLLSLNLSVVCIEKKEEDENSYSPDENKDARTTALLQPSIEFLKDIEIWEEFEEISQPLNSLIICNKSFDTGDISHSCEFRASDLNLKQLGFNISNDYMKKVLKTRLRSSQNFQFLTKDSVCNTIPRLEDVIAVTQSGKKICSKLIIGADGTYSLIRESSSIQAFKINYNQIASVFSIEHEKEHFGRSYEIYENEGPCTLVPLKTTEKNGYNSSVVLVQSPKSSRAIDMMNKKQQSHFLSLRSGNVLGKCMVKTRLAKFPIISQIATRFTGDRLLLLAESAHTMPPIGAQGLNSSIKDLSVLKDLIRSDSDPRNFLGSPKMLSEFEKARFKNIGTKMFGVHSLNQISIGSSRLSVGLRSLGLSLLEKNFKIKKLAMELGMFERLKIEN